MHLRSSDAPHIIELLNVNKLIIINHRAAVGIHFSARCLGHPRSTVPKLFCSTHPASSRDTSTVNYRSRCTRAESAGRNVQSSAQLKITIDKRSPANDLRCSNWCPNWLLVTTRVTCRSTCTFCSSRSD